MLKSWLDVALETGGWSHDFDPELVLEEWWRRRRKVLKVVTMEMGRKKRHSISEADQLAQFSEAGLLAQKPSEVGHFGQKSPELDHLALAGQKIFVAKFGQLMLVQKLKMELGVDVGQEPG